MGNKSKTKLLTSRYASSVSYRWDKNCTSVSSRYRKKIYGKFSQKMIDKVLSLSAFPPELPIKRLNSKSFWSIRKSKNLGDDSLNLNTFINICNIVWELLTRWKSFLVGSEAGSIALLNVLCLYGGYFCAEMPQRGIFCNKEKLQSLLIKVMAEHRVLLYYKTLWFTHFAPGLEFSILASF